MSVIQYNINFRNKQLDQVAVTITDYENYDINGDNPIFHVDLLGVAPAFELETFNTNEDKFSPILGKRATIRFKSTNAVNFSTFSSGEDYRFFVRATYNGGANYIFSGWLIMDDNQQAYLPPGQPVTLYATDNLGALKNIELSDFNGARPTGKHKLIKIIAWCLKKTNGSFLSYTDRIKVAVNLFEFFHHDRVNNCPLNQTYVDVLTFEKNVGEFEDCFTVLEKILFSFGARGCYYENDFYILRIDEYKNSAFVLHTYDTGGTYISRTMPFTLDKAIGNNIKFVKAETVQRIQRPYKSAVVKADYEFPEELLANLNFRRGTLSFSSVGPPPFDAYIPADWSYENDNGTPHTDLWYVKVIKDAGNREIERFIHLGSSAGTYKILRSQNIYVCVNDKFQFQFDFRYSSDLGGGSGHFTIDQALAKLYADDGTFWILKAHVGQNVSDPTFRWRQSNSTWTTNFSAIVLEGESENVDFTQWQNIDVECPPIPKTGYIEINLAFNNPGTGMGQAPFKDFSNLSFDYIPLIDGTYDNLSGEQFKMSTNDEYSKKYDETYALFDAPCKSFKGAMFYLDGGNYFQTGNWFDFAMGQYALTDLMDFNYTFLHWQCNAAWNQARLETWLLQSSLFGLDTANGHAGLIHKYNVINTLNPIARMSFIILSYRQDWHNCTWAATIAEINDSADRRQGGGTNGQNFEFKYLENG